MEEKNLQHQPAEIQILNESSRFQPKIILREVRESAMLESKWNSSSFHQLLTDRDRHLGDTINASIWTGNYHLLDIVIPLQALLHILTRLITGQIELSFDIALERLANGHTRLGLQSVMRRLLDDIRNFLISLWNGLGNVGHGLLISNSIADADTEAIVEKPEVDNHLYASEELTSFLRTLFTKYDVHKTSLRRSDSFLLNNPENELAIIEYWIQRFWITFVGLWKNGLLESKSRWRCVKGKVTCHGTHAIWAWLSSLCCLLQMNSCANKTKNYVLRVHLIAIEIGIVRS